MYDLMLYGLVYLISAVASVPELKSSSMPFNFNGDEWTCIEQAYSMPFVLLIVARYYVEYVRLVQAHIKVRLPTRPRICWLEKKDHESLSP